MNDNTILKNILDELNLLGFNLNHVGTYMIADSIYMIHDSKNLNLINNISKNIYEKIAKKYDKKIETVKSDIVKATNYINSYGNKKVIEKYFSTSVAITPKLVITSVLNKIN